MMFNTKKHRQLNAQAGFTLIELALVIVIIGLIVAGVLAGQDLIKAAQVRAQIQQFNQFDAAANTFRAKYDCMPGDCRRASQFGLGANGNGDGLVRDVNYGAGPQFYNAFDGEVAEFWPQLSVAGLVAGTYSVGGASIGTNFPKAKIGKGGIIVLNEWRTDFNAYIFPMDEGGLNYFGYRFEDNQYYGGFTPFEAFTFDSKIDDGHPDTGGVRAFFLSIHNAGDSEPSGASADPSGCSGSDEEYNVSFQAEVCGLHVFMK